MAYYWQDRCGSLEVENDKLIQENAALKKRLLAQESNWEKEKEVWKRDWDEADMAREKAEARIKELEAERRRDAIDGQAALDEANNAIQMKAEQAESKIAELQSNGLELSIQLGEAIAEQEKAEAELARIKSDLCDEKNKYYAALDLAKKRGDNLNLLVAAVEKHRERCAEGGYILELDRKLYSVLDGIKGV